MPSTSTPSARDLIDNTPTASRFWAVKGERCPVTDKSFDTGSQAVSVGDAILSREGYAQLRESCIAATQQAVKDLAASIDRRLVERRRALTALRKSKNYTPEMEAPLKAQAQKELDAVQANLDLRMKTLEQLQATPTLQELPESTYIVPEDIVKARTATDTSDQKCHWYKDTIKAGDSYIVGTTEEGKEVIISQAAYVRALRHIWMPLVSGSKVVETTILYEAGRVSVLVDEALHDFIVSARARYTGGARQTVRRRDIYGIPFAIEVKGGVRAITGLITGQTVQ